MLTQARRAPAVALAIGLALAAATALFLARFRPPIQLASEILPPLAGAAVVLLAATGVAHAVRFRRLADQIAAGVPLFGTVCAIVALADARAVLPLTIACACWGAFVLSRRRLDVWRPVPPSLWLPLLIAAAASIAPVNSPDELVYKLGVPAQWLLHDRMVELPLNSNSYLAMALQGADLAALALAGGVAAKLVHLAIFASALAIARRIAGDSGAAILAWTPALLIIAGWAWNDWGVIAALLLSYSMWESGDEWRSGIALGCAAACKYTALPWVLAFAVVVLLRERGLTRRVGRVFLAAAIAGGFFYLRNVVWTGSPFAPLLLPHAPEVQNFRGSGWGSLIRGADIFDASIADESLGILLPVAALAALFTWRRQRDLVILGVVQLPILLAIAPGSRNIVTGVIPLALAGVVQFGEEVRRRTLLRLICGAAVIAQLVLVVYTLETYDFIRYLSGRENAAEYIARTRSFAKPYAWLAQHTRTDARLLLLGETRTFYLPRQSLAGGNLDGPRVAAWLARFSTAEALRDELRRQHVSYVAIHTRWYAVGGPPPGVLEKEYVLQVTPQTHAVLMRYLATRASRVYNDGEYVIYRCL